MHIFWSLQKRTEKALHYVFRAGTCVRTWNMKTYTASTFFPETPDIFYVFLSGNVCFRPGKRTFHGRETYVSPDGNIEILNATKDYLTGISSIRKAWRGKNGTLEGEKTEHLKNKGDAYKEEQAGEYGKNKRNGLQENVQKNRQIRNGPETRKEMTSPTDIKKGVPLNSNLC